MIFTELSVRKLSWALKNWVTKENQKEELTMSLTDRSEGRIYFLEETKLHHCYMLEKRHGRKGGKSKQRQIWTARTVTVLWWWWWRRKMEKWQGNYFSNKGTQKLEKKLEIRRSTVSYLPLPTTTWLPSSMIWLHHPLPISSHANQTGCHATHLLLKRKQMTLLHRVMVLSATWSWIWEGAAKRGPRRWNSMTRSQHWTSSFQDSSAWRQQRLRKFDCRGIFKVFSSQDFYNILLTFSLSFAESLWKLEDFYISWHAT